MNLPRRAFVAGTMLLATAALGNAARPTRRLADLGPRLDLEQVIPRRFAAWQVDARIPVLLPSADVQAKLDLIYNQVLARTFVDDQGRQVMLSIAYGGDQSRGTRAHRPEVCYPAQGFELLAEQAGLLSLPGQTIPVRRLVTRLSSRNEPVTYWMVIGEQVVTTGTEQRLAELRYGLRGLVPDGLLVRISTIDRDADRAYAVQAGFAADLASAIDPTWRPRFVGRPA